MVVYFTGSYCTRQTKADVPDFDPDSKKTDSSEQDFFSLKTV